MKQRQETNSELIPITRVYNVHDLATQFKGLSHWFDKDSMKFFKTRLTSKFKCILDTEYKKVYMFVTTEKKSFSDETRAGNIRIATVESIPCDDRSRFFKVNIKTFGEFCEMSPKQASYRYSKLTSEDVLKHLDS